MAAALELLADLADIDRRDFRAGADADFVFGKFLEKYGRFDAFDRAEVIDDAFVVFGEDLEFLDDIQRQRESGDPVVRMKLGGVQRVAKEVETAARLAVIHRAGEAGDIHAAGDQVRGGGEGALVRSGVLE